MPANLSAVQWMTVEEVAELWAPQLKLPQSLVCQELRLALYKISAASSELPTIQYQRFKTPLTAFPPEADLPPRSTRVDREFLKRFCDKELWLLPAFWFGSGSHLPSFPGRPSIMAAIMNELRRIDADGGLEESVRAQAKILEQWARENVPSAHYPTAKAIENNIRSE
jgi:hypothetical protein